MSKVDVKHLEKIAKTLDSMVGLGEDIMKDGKIDLADLQHAPKLVALIGDLITEIRAYKEIGAEIKDIDLEEAKRVLDSLFGRM